MYSMIAYYTGPELVQTIWQAIWSKPGELMYLYNPVLYESGNPKALKNYGTQQLKLPLNHQLSAAGVEMMIALVIKEKLMPAIKLGKRLIPVDTIDVFVSRHPL
jgi:hypothetical protein